MLSLGREDDDEDNHLCIKCNATITGLDSYVKHRREHCGKRKYDPLSNIKENGAKISSIDPLEPSYSLGADVFFQSLELQSSVKRTSRLTPPVTSTVTSSSLDRKCESMMTSSSSRDVPITSPLENNLQGEDWIGGHTLRIVCNEDNQTRLINAVNDISGVAKKDIPSTSYNISYNEDDDEDKNFDDALEESEEDEEEDVHASGGKWKPPLHYTGGKWRPVSPDHDDWELREEHTGGKWKPIMPSDATDRDDDYDAPPPSHTKGKWIPGANEQKTQIMQNTIQSKGSVQYWCGACNRRLGSRAIYEKHLQSNLHMKKILPENDLEFSGHLHSKREIKEKRSARPSQYLDNTVYAQMQRKKKTAMNVGRSDKKKRKRTSYFVHCSGCKSRVRLHLMGKHLISHYHFRKATNIHSEAYQQLILDNIEAIVHQSPFQCSPCKFYTNWLSNLMQHWFTDEHEKKMLSIEGRYWCSFCKYECEDSEGMLQHMSSPGHSEVVAVINRSMPIIMRKKKVLKCKTCFEEFRYNIELRKHCEKTGHVLPHTATDLYQELNNCDFCKCRFKSSLTLAAHLKSKHKQKSFFCLVCSLTFESSAEAKRHRYTSDHRIRQKERLKERGVLIKDMRKKCPYCLEKVLLKNVLELKDHIRKVHPNNKKKCTKCGKAFLLPQEVTKHVRDKECTFENIDADPDLMNSSILWKCSQCLFQTNSQAECIFHEVLHTKPDIELKTGTTDKLIQKYKCPLCPKLFRKASLRLHIRLHTCERPLVCAICSASFTRQSALTTHVNVEHNRQKEDTALVALDVPVNMNDACKTVNISASISPVPVKRRRRQPHDGKLKRHECPLCDFKSDQMSHMKRHAICHDGTKPYGCPHCEFTCGSLENLRKHVLRGNRHAGLPLYQCPRCNHGNSRASELRSHLLSAHPEHYTAAKAAYTVKVHLLRDQF